MSARDDSGLARALLGAQWSDRELCLQACGLLTLLGRHDRLPAAVVAAADHVRSRLIASAHGQNEPDWGGLAHYLRGVLSDCGVATAPPPRRAA